MIRFDIDDRVAIQRFHTADGSVVNWRAGKVLDIGRSGALVLFDDDHKMWVQTSRLWFVTKEGDSTTMETSKTRPGQKPAPKAAAVKTAETSQKPTETWVAKQQINKSADTAQAPAAQPERTGNSDLVSIEDNEAIALFLRLKKHVLPMLDKRCAELREKIDASDKRLKTLREEKQSLIGRIDAIDRDIENETLAGGEYIEELLTIEEEAKK